MGDRISVIIPTHRRVKELERSLKSVVMQTYENIEIIIINDYPPDREAIEAAYRNFDFRIRIVHNEHNMGAPASRNRGIEESSGNLITLLDDDDVWNPSKLEKQVNLLEADPNLGFVGCGYHDEWLEKDRYPNLRGRIDEQLLVSFSNIETSTIMIRRPVLEEVGPIDITLPSEQNHDFFYRISKVTEFDYVPEVLVVKKAPEKQISRSPKNKIVGYVRYHRNHMSDIKALGTGRFLMTMGKFTFTLGLFLLFSGNEKRIDSLYEGVFRKIQHKA
jgi:glycosyltransferase involved in cell wall biosynthesis